MKSAKIIVGLFVLAIAGGLSLYIFVNGKANEFPEVKTATSASSMGNDVAASVIKNYITEKLPEEVAKQEATDTPSQSITIAAVDPNNLTELFARQLAKEVVLKNPQGPLTADDGSQKLNFPGTLDYQAFLSQGAGQLDWKKNAYKEQNIKITADNSKASVIGYLNSTLDILTKNFNGVSFSTDIKDVNAIQDEATIIEEKLIEIISEMSSLSVPEKFVSTHRQILQIIEGKRIAFEKLKNSKNDPLGGLMATQWLQDIQKEEATLQPNLLAIVKENNFFKDK